VNWAVSQVRYKVSWKAAQETVIQPMMQLHIAVCCRAS